MTHDVRYAMRSLARNPGFTIAAVLTLAIGIGAATAISSLVDTILFRPLPFPDGDRLVRLVEYGPHFQAGRPPLTRGITYQEYLDWRDRATTIEEAAAIVAMSQRMVTTPEGAAGLWGAMVSGNTFQLLKTTPHLGRVLVPEDEADPTVVVLSYDTWRRHYHADPAILGRALEFRMGALLAERPPMFLTVVGVLPRDFAFPTGTLDFVMPIALNPSQPSPGAATLARLAPAVSLQAATDEADAMGTAMRPPWPADRLPPAGPRFEVQSLKERAVAPLRPALSVLAAAVAVVLLIVCANVANLLLARGVARRRETAVRLALGASRGRVFRDALIECAVLALAGGALGALLGAAGVTLVKSLATVDAPGIFRLMFGVNVLPRANEMAVDWRLFGIAFTIAAGTCVAFGLLPAWHLSRTVQAPDTGGRGDTGGRMASRLRGALTLVQVTLATVLLIGAGLLAHSFVTLARVDKGYDERGVVVAQLLLPDSYPVPRKTATIDAVLQRLRALPHVQAAGFSRHGVLIGEELTLGTFVPPERAIEEMRNLPDRPRVRAVSDGFLTAIGARPIAGRDLAPGDDASAPLAIVVNRSAAQQLFPGDGQVVGRTLDWHLGQAVPVTIVGLVDDIRQASLTADGYPEVFADYRQLLALLDRVPELRARQNEWVIGFLSFAIHTAGDPAQVVLRSREVIRAVDPAIGIDAIAPLGDVVRISMARERFYMVIAGVLATVSTLLAAIGLYGLLAYAVVQRTREIGVRMALGARAGHVLALVMRQGFGLTAAGVSLGLAVAAAGARALESMLFGIEPLDLATFAAVAVGLAAVAGVASFLPARRATRIDPVVALRQD